jgi:hypothetical protein
VVPAPGTQNAVFTIPVQSDGTFAAASVPTGEWKVVIKLGGRFGDMAPDKQKEFEKNRAAMVAAGQVPDVPTKYSDPATSTLTWKIEPGVNPRKEFVLEP